MRAKAAIVLDQVLRVMRPLVRLLIRGGVPYQAFATALKHVFVEAARAELASRSMTQTDSAVTLLSGVHRRDVRNLSRPASSRKADQEPTRSLPAEVIARWMSDPAYLDANQSPRLLGRSSEGAGGSFDALVAGVSRDVRPRAMLDELLRLGAAREENDGIRLMGTGFAPRQDFEELSRLFADNVGDHAAAAVANLQGERNFLEQSVFVDEITESSAAQLQKVSVQAWKQAFKTVMDEAQARFDDDSVSASAGERRHRARFGVYFYTDREDSVVGTDCGDDGAPTA
jgi:hypothetical protein